MDLKRFFVEDHEIGKFVEIKGEEFVHATKVTRHKVGYKLIVCNGTEYDYYGTIKEITKTSLLVEIEKKVHNPAISLTDITLYIGAGKVLDDVVQKAVELGINTLVPFYSQHTNGDKVNVERLNKIVLESSKQCGRSSLMKIGEPLFFGKALVSAAANGKIYLFYEQERKNRLSKKLEKEKSFSVFIGAEGGFSLEEIALAKDKGAEVLTLGKRILRVETAVTCALALCLNALGDI